LEKSLQDDDIQAQAEIYLSIADDHFEHSNMFLAKRNFELALSRATQVDNLGWVRRAHSGLGQIDAEEGACS
jgi:Tfp pilus assembly protein PilF